MQSITKSNESTFADKILENITKEAKSKWNKSIRDNVMEALKTNKQVSSSMDFLAQSLKDNDVNKFAADVKDVISHLNELANDLKFWSHAKNLKD